MAELAYALGLGPSVARLEGSSPSVRISLKILMVWRFLVHEKWRQARGLKKRGKRGGKHKIDLFIIGGVVGGVIGLTSSGWRGGPRKSK